MSPKAQQGCVDWRGGSVSISPHYCSQPGSNYASSQAGQDTSVLLFIKSEHSVGECLYSMSKVLGLSHSTVPTKE